MSIISMEISSRAIGNALFEYATLFGVGCKLNLDIRLPKGNNHTHGPTGQKIWQLKEIFDIKTPYISDSELSNIQHTYTEKRKQFNPEIFEEVKDNTNLIGFFQHEDYFKDCENELRKQLVFKKDWVFESHDKFNKLGLNPDNCIAIHVRRGDYCSPHLQPFHPVIPLDYYYTAINYVADQIVKNQENTSSYHLVIFSDDINACKKEFNSDSMTFVENEGETANILDFCMMSFCKYHIIANSSYSYWAAWLAKSKLVCYPNQWFGYGYDNYNIVSNPNWVKI